MWERHIGIIKKMSLLDKMKDQGGNNRNNVCIHDNVVGMQNGFYKFGVLRNCYYICSVLINLKEGTFMSS